MATKNTVIGATAMALALSPLLVGCGSSSGTHPSGKGTDAAKRTSIPAGNNGHLKNPVGAISELSGFSCTKDAAGSWSASGVVSNRSTSSTGYILQVTVIEKKVDTVVGNVQKQFTVAAGHRVQIKAPNFYKSRKANLQCAPRLVKGGS